MTKSEIMLLLLLWILLSCAMITQADIVSVSCDHINNSPVNVLNLTQFHRENISDFSLNITTSLEANVFIESECCDQIDVSSSSCSRKCTPTGMKVCHLTSEQTLRFDLNQCLNASSVNVTCLSSMYTSKATSLVPSSPTTRTTTKRQTASSTTAETTLFFFPTTSTVSMATKTNTTQPNENTSSTLSSPTLTTHHNGSTAEFLTNVPTLSSTIKPNLTIQTTNSAVTPLTTTTRNSSTTFSPTALTVHTSSAVSNETSTVSQFDESQAMKDLYTFLIVLAVVLILVTILVVGFFIRKKREKVSISSADYPLEYWHNQEYVDNIVEKSYSPKSFTLNPVYGNKHSPNTSQTVRNKRELESSGASPTSKKKEESDYKSGHQHSRISEKVSADLPRKTKHDFAEKYVATAIGSNFYSYEHPEPMTNLDDESENDQVDTLKGGSTSFKPTTGKGPRRKKRSGGERRRSGDDEADERRDSMEVYAVSYKEKLKKSLDHWSAEESDV